MNRVLRLASHEFIKHLRRPSFILSTLLVPLIGIILVVLPRWLGGDAASSSVPIQPASTTPIGYVDQSGLITRPPADVAPTLVRAFPDEAAARAAAAAGEIRVFYVIPPDYLERGAVTRYGGDALGNDTSLFRSLVLANLLDGDAQLIARLEEPLALETVRLDAAGNVIRDERGPVREGSLFAFAVPYAFAMALYITIFSASSFLLQSVTEEKENRTIEIILTSLRPWQLLAGKVLGLGLLGLTQVLIWMAIGVLSLRVGIGTAGLTGQGLALPWSVWALALVYFVLGYLVYGSVIAGIGATVTNVREGSQLLAVLVMPFIIPLWFLGPIVAQPDGMLATILSLVPFTAPVTMMIRVPLTDIAPGQIALSLALLLICALLALWVAARLFRVSTLLAGQRLNGRALLRALRAG